MRPLFAVFFLLAAAFSLPYFDRERVAQGEIQVTLREQIIRNTQHIADMDRDIQEVKRWQWEHGRDQGANNETQATRIREVEVKVEAHEKIIWILVVASITFFIGLIGSFVKNRSGTELSGRTKETRGYDAKTQS